MNFFETLLTVAVAVAVVPYKVAVDPISEEENAPKKVSVESLVYRVDVTPKKAEDGTVGRDISFTIPAEGVKKMFGFVKGSAVTVGKQAVVVKDKVVETAGTVRGKVTETVASIRAKRAAKKGDIVVEGAEPVIDVTDVDAVAEEIPAEA